MHTEPIIVRLCLIVVLATLTAPALRAAPAPLPKPERARDRATFNVRKRELQERRIWLLEVSEDGPGRWRVTILDFRREVLRRRICHLTTPDRLSALSLLLEECRAEDSSPPNDNLCMVLR